MALYLYVNESVLGPYGVEEVKDMVSHREIPSDTLACRAGEPEWKTLEECLGLKPSAAKGGATPIRAGAKGGGAEADIRYLPKEIKDPGIGRSTYFLGNLGLFGLAYIFETRFGADWYVATAPIISLLSLLLIVLRLRNIGKSAWMCFLSIIPFVNVYYLIFWQAAQSGYERTKKLDSNGRTIVGLCIGLIVLLFALIFLALAIGC
jgi:uncharacterized membrane protein YhaH (DUF805 family)